MKKMDVLSFAAIVISCAALAALKLTGMTVHIVVSVVALAVMVFCTVKGRKDWKVPALEIAYRVCYFLALASGVAMVAAHIGGAVSVAHKVFAGLFAVLYVVTFLVNSKKA